MRVLKNKKVRKSYFVNTDMVKKAVRLLNVNSEAEAIRIAIQRTVEMEEFWRFMDKTAGLIERGSFK